MRAIVFYIFVFLAAVCANAQTVQLGVVKEYNEKAQKTPLPGVEVRVKSAGNTVSGDDGRFRLEFLTLNPGQSVIVRSIEKLGYEIFNKEALEQWSINPDRPFLIVMCRSDKFKRLRDNYESKASESYNRQYKKEIAALENLRKEGKIKDEEYRKSLREIQANYDRQLDNLDNYVDRFARIDLSEISADEQAIIELVQQGRFDEAIVKYDEMEIVNKLVAGIREHQDIKSAQEQLARLEGAYAESIDSLYSMAERQIEFLKLVGGADNNKKIANIYITIADADSTNVDWLSKTGKFLSDYMGDYPKAMEYLQKALVIREKVFGLEHPDVALSYNNIGVVYSFMGDYPKALEYHQKALAILEKVLEPEHPDVATSYNNIGTVYDSMGDYSKALEYIQKALAIREKILEPEHPDVSLSYSNIGMVYDSMDDYPKALEYLQKALAIREKILGLEHPDVALSYNNIGSVYSSMGDYPKALEYLQKSLAIRKKVFGPEHPNVALSCNNIGYVYGLIGDYPTSLEYLQKALAILEKVLGSEHPNVALSYNNIGSVYSSMGDYPKALEYHQQALAIRKKVFGPEHPNVALSCNNIGYVYGLIGDYPTSLEYLQKSLAIRKKVLVPEHPKVATSYYNIGYVYGLTGDYHKALGYHQQALAIWEKVLEPGHPHVAMSYVGIYESICRLVGQNKDYHSKFLEFMSDKMPNLTVLDGGAAASQGTAGEYFILEFGNWHFEDSESLFDEDNELKGKAKRIVTMKDGIIYVNHFQNQTDVKLGIKKIGTEAKQNIVNLYNQWKAENK